MSGTEKLEAERWALVEFARLSLIIFAINQCPRTKAIADEALGRVADTDRKVEQLRRTLRRQQKSVKALRSRT